MTPQDDAANVDQPPASDPDGTEEEGQDQTPTDVSDEAEEKQLLSWQSVEYIQHHHSALWYIGLALVTAGFMAVAIWLIKSVTFAILLPVMAIALVVYTRRPPATIDYTLTTRGLYVRDKLHPYASFKGFAVSTHNDVNSIQFIPRKRFQIGQIAYFPTEVGESLVDTLAAYLPMQTKDPDLYDRIIAKLRM